MGRSILDDTHAVVHRGPLAFLPVCSYWSRANDEALLVGVRWKGVECPDCLRAKPEPRSFVCDDATLTAP